MIPTTSPTVSFPPSPVSRNSSGFLNPEHPIPDTVPDAVPKPSLGIQRLLTQEGASVWDTVIWENRDAVIVDKDGKTVFEQRGIEVPSTWSQTATNVVASKYFRVVNGIRESSVRQMIERVSATITDWGLQDGYFDTATAAVFEAELQYLLLHQMASFNSPVWFNIGVPGAVQTGSACYILSLKDSMPDILEWYRQEGMIFSRGAGSGVNISGLRGKGEPISKGGTSCFTADQRVLSFRGAIPIASIIPGDEVITPNGIFPVTHLHNNGSSHVIEVEFEDGRKIKTTMGHEFFCLSTKGELVKVPIGKITDDYVPVFFSPFFCDIGEFGKDFQFSGRSHRPYKNGSFDFFLDPSFGWLLGFIVGNGHIHRSKRRSYINLTCDYTKQDIVNKVVDAINKLGLSCTISHEEELVRTVIVIGNSALVDVLDMHGLLKDKSNNACVPSILWESKPHIIAAFLSGYFDADGCHDKSGNVFYKTVSKQLAYETQELLGMLGIRALVRHSIPRQRGRLRSYKISIPSFRWKTLFARWAQESLKMREWDCGVNNRIGSWPFNALKLFVENKSLRCKLAETIMPYNSKNTSYRSMVRLFEALLEHGYEESAEKIGKILQYIPTRIKTITDLGIFPVYDITVQDAHQYIVNGMIVSNSGPMSFARAADASAFSIKSGGSTRRSARMLVMNADHPDIEEFLNAKRREEAKARTLKAAGFDDSLDGEIYGTVAHQNCNMSLSAPDAFLEAVEQDRLWETRYVTTGEVAQRLPARDLMRQLAQGTWECGDPGIQYQDTINAWHTCPESGSIKSSNPCSEYFFLDDTACNLSSLNLLKFLQRDESFDTGSFRHAVDVMITAKEILVSRSSYPTEAITQNSHDYRTLGIGYANLGALLMAQGLPYDSDEGRDYAASITALMTGEAYAQSARLAVVKGPFPGYQTNKESMQRVIQKHIAHLPTLLNLLETQKGYVYLDTAKKGSHPIWVAATETWTGTRILGHRHGYRNAQVSLLAPTGTISIMMDCDTTGCEPDTSLIGYKALVGGGTIKRVNHSVSRGLRRLGYFEDFIQSARAHIDFHGSLEGFPDPAWRPSHYPVFDCAFPVTPGGRAIHWRGHMKMVAALQPFLSGGISKTINMPQDATVEDIEAAYLEAWQMGCKSMAIYRDGSKATQVLTTQNPDAVPVPAIVPVAVPYRRRLPDERPALTHKATIASHEFYVTIGLFEDGSPGEIFLRMAKEGSTISGLMDAFATSISMALQYGVPLRALCDKFQHSRFEPAGFTKHPEIRIATSITDYLFRYLALKFLTDPVSITQHNLTPEEAMDTLVALGQAMGDYDTPETGSRNQVRSDAPVCSECGSLTKISGNCSVCTNCGTSMGCS